MAFWALGKMKGLSQKLNIKQYGSKLKSYVNSNIHEDEDQSNNPFYEQQLSHKQNNIPSQKLHRSEEQLLQIQTRQYQKLCAMEKRILSKCRNAQLKQIQEKNKVLMNELEKLDEQEQEERHMAEKISLIQEIQTGKKKIQDVIQENLVIREQIESNRVKNGG